MLSPEQRRLVLEKAYVPEHIVPLMEGLSGGQAYLTGDFLFLVGGDWLIMVGFPLGESSGPDMEKILRLMEERFRPSRSWFVGPEVPGFLKGVCQELEEDQYYRLDLVTLEHGPRVPRRNLQRLAAKARERFSLQCNNRFNSRHRQLTQELMERANPGARIRELYRRMPTYLEQTPSAVLLSAWDPLGRLAAYAVLELAAYRFSAYVAGASSREKWAAHASDLLMAEMIRISIRENKQFMHLGLGVNPGISGFKKKWGGVPWMDYRACGWSRPISAAGRFFKSLARIVY